ncbi:MAG: minor capsid protein [Oscillospiraceae bacterium]|nr:minor capsid protein [Oscillospiraceae bacterium]
MVTAPIPRYLLPHAVTLVEALSSDPWGGKGQELRTVINFVRIEPCRSRSFSLGGDIPEIKAKLFFDAFSSVPNDVSFETGDKVIFGSEEFIVSEVQEFYGTTGDIHHLEVLLK